MFDKTLIKFISKLLLLYITLVQQRIGQNESQGTSFTLNKGLTHLVHTYNYSVGARFGEKLYFYIQS